MRIIDNLRHNIRSEIFTAFAGIEFAQSGINGIGTGLKSGKRTGRAAGRSKNFRKYHNSHLFYIICHPLTILADREKFKTENDIYSELVQIQAQKNAFFHF